MLGWSFRWRCLLGTLLAIQRLSGESEITAMKAGGISFMRIVIPLLAAGFVMSFVTFVVQEIVAPFANDQVTQIENQVIARASAFNRDLTVSAPLPGGGKQITIATSYDTGLAGAAARDADSIRSQRRRDADHLCRPCRIYGRQVGA